jgi:hypothetical protein
MPWPIRRSSSTDLTSELSCSAEIVLEARAGHHGAQRLDRGVELSFDGFGLGQGARIGLVLAGAMAVEREFVEQMRGRRGGMRFAVGVGVGKGEDAFVA